MKASSCIDIFALYRALLRISIAGMINHDHLTATTTPQIHLDDLREKEELKK